MRGVRIENASLISIGGGRESNPLGLSVEIMSRSPNPGSSIPPVITFTESPGKVSFGLGRSHYSTRVGTVECSGVWLASAHSSGPVFNVLNRAECQQLRR